MADENYTAAETRINADTVRITHTFMAPPIPAETPLTSLWVRFGAVNSTAPVRFRVETDAAGAPSGTLAWPGATGVCASPPAYSGAGFTFDSPGRPVPGQLCHVVLSRDGAGVIDLFVARSKSDVTALPAVLRSGNSGASWASYAGPLAIIGGTATGSEFLFGSNIAGVSNTSFSSASSPNEYGLRIASLPSKIRAIGVQARAYISDGGSAVARLYHPGGVVTSDPLHGTALPEYPDIPTVNLTFSDPVELDSGDEIRVTLHATAGTVSVNQSYGGLSTAYGAFAGIQATSRSYSGGAGSWTDSFGWQQAISLLIDQIDDGAGDGVYPDVSHVLTGVEYGPGADDLTGELVLPPVGTVRAGTAYGPESGLVGTLGLPAEADVRIGVHFGANANEFEGNLESGGGGSGSVVFHPGMNGGFNG
jgi:hypothetical protein